MLPAGGSGTFPRNIGSVVERFLYIRYALDGSLQLRVIVTGTLQNFFFRFQLFLQIILDRFRLLHFTGILLRYANFCCLVFLKLDITEIYL